MLFAIYRKNEKGLSFHGVETQGSRDALLRRYGVVGSSTGTDTLSAEWPDRSVEWFGEFGYAVRDSGKLKMRQINLTDDQVEVAKTLGGGNVSAGIRLALSAFE